MSAAPGRPVTTRDLRPGMRVSLSAGPARWVPGTAAVGVVMAVQLHAAAALVTVDTRTSTVRIRCGSDATWHVLPAV